MNEFPHFPNPIPRRGFTSIEALDFMRRELPAVKQWTCWRDGDAGFPLLHKLLTAERPTSGQFGEWSVERVPCSYPVLTYWRGGISSYRLAAPWTGLVRVKGPCAVEFLMFAYLTSVGNVGDHYLVSTPDVAVLQRFLTAVRDHFAPAPIGTIHIEVHGGDNIPLGAEADERVFLPGELQQDIEQQTLSFFENAPLYHKLGIRHRRGFLFVGKPGTGKTMMLRHLIRRCHRQFHPEVYMLVITRRTDESDVSGLLTRAAQHAPSLVILEDMDSLTRECQITRAALLAQLDGLVTKQGVLIIGTTNNAGEIDPALVHRPSRFDRVWHFPLPDLELRRKYLAFVIKDVNKAVLDTLAQQTEDWSFAYLKELHTSAAIMAVTHGTDALNEEWLVKAHALLATQFSAGRQNHVRLPGFEVGFKAA